MTELVLSLSRAGYNSLSLRASGVYKRINTPARTRDIVWVGIVLCALQLMDGVLTGVGVYRFGHDIEANPLIRNMMIQIGIVQALILVKMLAVLIIGVLCRLACKVGWVTLALQAVALLYITAAIVPWTAILLFRTA